MSSSRTGRPPVQRAARRPVAARPARENPVLRLYTRARKAWDRPLTAYYLILGGSLLITVLGLVMVYSASQITALQMSLPGSFFFRKQFLAAAIGAGLLLVASRMPVKLHRALAYPILAGAVFLMALVQVPGIGMSVNGNQNWISLGGSFQIQPSEFGKLALVLWAADLLARKQDKKLLTQWKHMLVPLVPVAFLLLGLIMFGRPSTCPRCWSPAARRAPGASTRSSSRSRPGSSRPGSRSCTRSALRTNCRMYSRCRECPPTSR